MSATAEPLFDDSAQPALRGFLHSPAQPSGYALALTHGAGSNCHAPLLVALAEAFSAAGIMVLRFDLPYRQARPHGPPRPGDAEHDRAGIRRAVEHLRRLVHGRGRIYAGGHSYGGRQTTMLGAEGALPRVAPPIVAQQIAALLLLSYPLHPPRKPEQLRTAHLPRLQTPSFFVHGARDSFATRAEMDAALKLIPARTELLSLESVGHDLGFRAGNSDLAAMVMRRFLAFAS